MRSTGWHGIRRFGALVAALGLTTLVCAQTMRPAPESPPPAAPQAVAAELLPALITHTRREATLRDGRLHGPGATWLLALAAEAQFVLLGENHGHAGTARLAGALWTGLVPRGYRHAAIETDPWVATALQRELRHGGLAAWGSFVRANGGAVAAPFYTWAEEAAFAAAVVDSHADAALWGLDQVFMGAVPWLLREIADTATAPAARAAAAPLAKAAQADLQWLARAEDSTLEALQGLLADPADADGAARVRALRVSRDIYRPFVGAGGEPFLANHARELLMKQQFLQHYRAATAAGQDLPRVLLKFGANHMFRGPTPTQVQGLGGFVTEFAVSTGGGGALSILVLCAPGGEVGALDGRRTGCDAQFDSDWAFLRPHLPDPGPAQALMLFDLRSWKLRPGRWSHLPHKVQQAISAFDVLLVMPGPAATWLPGVSAWQPPR